MVTILLFNFPETEQKSWRFLLRKMPGIRLLPVEREQFGLTIGQLLEGETAPGNPEGAAFSERMVVFAGIPGTLLSLLIDISHQVTAEKTYRAVLTDNNRNWNASELMFHLQAEEAQLRMRRK